MPKILGKAVRVVETHGGALTIDEFVGKVASGDDSISVAHVQINEPTSEPWLTLDYDEWICVLRGQVNLHMEDDGSDVITVHAGETAFVAKGERFRPVFPVKDTVYVPICRPAFSPDRCHREEDGTSVVSAKLQQLHGKHKIESSATSSNNTYDHVDKLFHMCQKGLWDDAVLGRKAYYPPTFEADGMFTHATAVPQRLIHTANHFYTETEGDWICLQLSRSALFQLGIRTVFEEAKPVGETDVSDTWDWVCPHIYGGLPTHVDGVVTNTYTMKRQADGKFLCIEGLTDLNWATATMTYERK